MTPRRDPVHDRGAVTLFLCLLMLLLVTLLVATAFTLSAAGLKSAGNIQVRREALAAAGLVIEAALGRPFRTFTTALPKQTVDINNDGHADYTVDLGAPHCVRASRVRTGTGTSVTLPGLADAPAWNTTWELQAVVTDPRTGVAQTVVQGVRVVLSDPEKVVGCPE